MTNHAIDDQTTVPALMPVYDRVDIYLERGEGVYAFDDRGKRYLDFGSAFAVTAFGHAHPDLTAALHAQAQKLWIASNSYKSHAQERIAQRLVDLSFADTVFFQNSGVEAWELCVKIIRSHFDAVGQPDRFRIITIEGCFHGRSLAAISAAKSEKMVKGFGPLVDGFDQVPFGDLAAMEAAITPQTAAINIETVMGEGGIKVWSPEQLRAIRALCDRHGLLLFLDEIQCGMGRTGKLFAYQHAGITPDVMSIAKALGNGFPVAAGMATARVAQGMTKGSHGSTYGGNPLAMAVVDKVLDMMTVPGFLDTVVARGAYLASKLDGLVAAHPALFTERRGIGLMQGLRCTAPSREVVTTIRHAGLLVMPASDNMARLLPPLIVTEAQIDEAVAIIDGVARTWKTA